MIHNESFTNYNGVSRELLDIFLHKYHRYIDLY